MIFSLKMVGRYCCEEVHGRTSLEDLAHGVGGLAPIRGATFQEPLLKRIYSMSFRSPISCTPRNLLLLLERERAIMLILMTQTRRCFACSCGTWGNGKRCVQFVYVLLVLLDLPK